MRNSGEQSATSRGEPIAITEFRDHAWDYFAFHAQQRLTTFHFFIVLETGLVGAMLITARISSDNTAPGLFAAIGLLIALFSFVFWKLDQRVKGMIKVSENALKAFEAHAIVDLNSLPGIAESIPFLNDPQVGGKVGLSPVGLLSYSKCFGIVFIAFGLVGVGTFLAFAFFSAGR